MQITMDNLVVSPAETSAKVGDTIEWINKDVFAHTATARSGDFDVILPPKKIGDVGSEEGGNGRLLLPLSSQHESDAQGSSRSEAGGAFPIGSGNNSRSIARLMLVRVRSASVR